MTQHTSSSFLILLLSLTTLLFLLLSALPLSRQKCAFTVTGTYYNDSMGGNPPSPYDGDPFVLPDPSLYEKLAKHCKNIPMNSPVCCNTTQANKMLNNLLRIDVTMWHCPSCLNNFKQMWCDFTCSPNQGDFVMVRDLYPPPLDQYINSVSFKMDSQWTVDFWNSCKDNVMGSAPLRKTYTNGQNMLQGLVDTDKPKPMVHFNFEDSPVPLPGGRYNRSVQPCEIGCMCTYCEAACHSGKQIQPDFTCRVGRLSCFHFGMIVLCACSALFMVAVLVGLVQRSVRWYTNIDTVPKTANIAAASERSRLLQ